MNILDISATAVNVSVQKGTLTFNHAEVKKDSNIATLDGDVIFQSEKDFSVFWENQNSYYCLGAPEGASIQSAKSPSGCWTDPKDLNSAKLYGGTSSNNCTASYSLCASAGCSGTPNMTLSAGRGNIYSNLIGKGTNSLPKEASTVTSAPFNGGGLDFDDAFNKTLNELNVQFQDRSKSDHMVLLKIGNYRARSTAASKITVSPNPAYVDMRPWWLSVFSASLLLGFPLRGTGRLMPGFCPFRTSLNTEQVYEMSELLRETFATPNQVVNIQSQFSGKLSQNFNQNSGFMASGGTDTWQTVVRTEHETLEIQSDSLSDNGPLFAAVIVSLVLAGLLSIVGLFALFYVLYSAFTTFSKDSAHIYKYAEKYYKSYLNSEEEQPQRNTRGYPQAQQGGKSAVAKERQELVTRIEVGYAERRGQLIAKTSEPLTIFGKMKLTLMNLPPPFALIDHVVFLIGRGITNSLIEYYKLVFKQIPVQDLEDSVNTMPLADFKLRYEKFCFLKSYEERLMTTEKNSQILSKYGFEIQKKKDNMTEVYKKIRFFTDVEEKTKMAQARQKISAQKALKPGTGKQLDSVSLFIQTNCVMTKFDTDSITVNTFKQKYQQFCEENRLSPLNITRSLMASYGVETEKLEVSYVCRKPVAVLKKEAQGKPIKYYTLQIQKADQVIEKFVLNYLAQEGMVSEKLEEEIKQRMKKEQKRNAFTQNWIFIDLVAVILHVAFAVVFALIPDIIVIFSQSMRAFYMTSAARDVLSYQDFIYTPWNIALKIGTLRAYDLAIFIASVIYAFLALVELIVYYATMPFPLNTLKYFTDLKKKERNVQKGRRNLQVTRNILATISQTIQWIYIFFFIALILGYIGLVLVWSILGAILNPTAYLYYAAAAGTFITYIGVKYRQLQDMQRQGFSNIMRIIEAKAKAMIDQVLKKVISATGVSDEMAKAIEATVEAAASGDLTKLEGAAIQFVNATPVGKSMASAGIDVGLAVRMAKGDMSAIVQFAQNKGIPAPVAQAIVSLLQRDMEGLINALKTLVTDDPLNLPPELVDIVVSLILRPGEVSRREVINTLGLTLYNILEENFQIQMPNFQICKAALPLIFQSITQLFKGDLDGFLNSLEQANELLLNSCEKSHTVSRKFKTAKLKELPTSGKQSKIIAQQQKQNNLSKPLFNEHGYPNFAVPRHLLSIVQFFKVPLSVLGVATVDKYRMKKALCDTLMSFASMDDDIIDFLIMTFAESHTRIHAIVRPGIITRPQQMSIINEMARELDLDQFIMKTLFKVVSVNKNLDERYFDQVNYRCRSLLQKLNRTQDQEYLHRDFVYVSYGLFSILNTVNVKRTLVKASRKFEIDRQTAQAVLKIASKVDYTEENWKNLITSDIIAVASKELRISKRDVSGLISLLMGDLKNPYIENILRSFCFRNKFSVQALPLLTALIILFTSKDNSEVLEAIRMLGLQKYQVLIMIGKKMIHPKYVDQRELIGFGIKEDSVRPEQGGILKERLNLTMDQADINDWISRAGKIMLSGKVLKKKEQLSEIPEEELEQNPIYFANSAKLGATIEMSKVMKQPTYYQRTNKSGLSLISRQKTSRAPIIDLTFGQKMLNIRNQNLSIEFLMQIVQKWRTQNYIDIKPFTPIEYELILKLLSVKDIIFRTSRQAVNLAIQNLVKLLDFKWPIINALANVITTDSEVAEGELNISINQIYKRKRGGQTRDVSTEENLAHFAKYVTEELTCISQSEKVVEILSSALGVPKSLVSGYLTPHLTQASIVTANDICYFFDVAGLNDYKFRKNELKLKNENVSLTRLKFIFANLYIGYIPDIKEVQTVFGIQGKLGALLEALTSSRQNARVQIMLRLYRDILTQQGLPKRVIETILAVFTFLKGSSESFEFEFQESIEHFKRRGQLLLQAQQENNIKDISLYKDPPRASADNYLAKMFGTYPEYFKSLQTILKGQYKRLLELLSTICQKAQELGTPLIPPQYIPGLISVASGKIYSTEDLAEKLLVSPDMLDVCILLSAIAKGGKKIGKNIFVLSSSNAFARFCKTVKLNKDAFSNLLRLSFNEVGSREISEVFGSLRLYQHCEEKYLKAIMAISRGSNNYDLFDTVQSDLAFKIRQEHVKELQSNLAPLCAPFGVPVELAVVNSRLRQGDFLIIEDYKEYLTPLLPDEKCRNLAMSLCGLLRCPIRYHNKLGNYPKELTYCANFEGALEYMKDALGINPLVFRLCTFDPEALQFVEQQYKVPRQVIIAFIVSLANLGHQIVDILLERDMYRCAYMELKRNDKKLKEMRENKKKNKLMKFRERLKQQKERLGQEGKDQGAANQTNLLENQEWAQQAKGRKLSFDTETYESSACQTYQDKFVDDIESIEDQEEGSGILSDSYSDFDDDQYSDEDDQSSVYESKNSPGGDDDEELQFDPFNTLYDTIDFQNPTYEAWYKEIIKIANLYSEGQINDLEEEKVPEVRKEEEEVDSEKSKGKSKKEEIKLDPEAEVIECVLFNTPHLMCYDFEKIMRDDKAKRNFNLQKAAREKIIGKKQEWDRAIISAFFPIPDDPQIWEEESEEDLESSQVVNQVLPSHRVLVGFDKYNWIRQKDRRHIKNIWAIMKKLMKDMSADLSATNGAYHDYDRIQLTQFLFAISILDIRKTLDSDSYSGKADDFAKMVLSLQQIFYWIERNAVIPEKLTSSFHPNRFLKVLGMATNMKISNYFDYFEEWRPNSFKYKIFEEVIEKFFLSKDDSSAQQGQNREYLQKVANYIILPDAEEKVKEMFKMTYIEDQSSAQDRLSQQLPRFTYEPTKWKKQIATADDNELASLLMIAPNQVHDLYQQDKDTQSTGVKDQQKIADQRSQLPIQKVYKFFQDIEKFMIAEPEALQLIVGIADNDETVWSFYKEQLKRANIIQRESALQVYKSVQKLINLKRVIKDYQYLKAKVQDHSTLEPPDIKPVLNSLTGGLSLDPIMVEDLIMLAQGNMEEIHFTNLANRFNLQSSLLKTFFLSLFLKNLRTPQQLSDFVEPMKSLLGVDNRILCAIINIVNYKKLGWKILGINLTKPTISVEQVDAEIRKVSKVQVDAFELINQVLSMIDWRELHSQVSTKKITSEQLKLTRNQYVKRILAIADKLDGQGTVNYADNQKLKLLLQLMHSVLINDLPSALQIIPKLPGELKFEAESDTLQQFSAVCLLTGKFNLSSKDMDTLVKEARNTLSNWLGEQIVYLPQPDQVTSLLQSFRSNVRGLIEFLYGYIYNFNEYLDNGAKILGGKFEKIYWVLRTLDNVKYYRRLEIIKILRNERAGAYLRKSFLLIAKMVDDNIREGKKKIKQHAETLGTDEKNSSLAFKGVKIYNKVCRSWEEMEKDDQDFADKHAKYSKYVLKNCIPESEKKVRGWLKRNNREPGQLGELEQQDVYLTLMTSLMGGDIHLFLNIMTNYLVDPENVTESDNQIIRTARLARSTFKMMKLSQGRFISEIRKIFKEEADQAEQNKDEEEEKEVSQISQSSKKTKKKQRGKEEAFSSDIMQFARDLSALNVQHFQNKIQGLKENSQNYQELLQKYQFSIQLFSKPDLLKFATCTLLAIKFNALGKQLVTSIIVKFVEIIFNLSKIDPVVQQSFTLLVEVFSGRKMDQIQTMSQQSASFSFLQKVEKLISIVVELFLPDLVNAQGLFRIIINIVTQLLNVKSLSEFGEVLIKIAPDVGDIFNADPIIVNGIIGILKGDYQALALMAAPIAKIDPETIRSTVHFLQEIKNAMSDYDGQTEEKNPEEQKFKGNRMREVMANIAAGKASYRELFEMLDAEGDGSGGISKDEFTMLLRRLNMKFSSHRIDEIFTSVQIKVSGAADDNPNELNELEFQEAMLYVEQRRASSTLKLLGISTGQLIFLFILLTFILLLLFVFIFLGVSALAIAGGGAFGSIINSLLPVASGAAVMQKKETDPQTDQKKADEAVDESDKILKTEQ